MVSISEIVKVGGMQYAIIPDYVVAKVCGTFEIWGINKDGSMFPVIDRGFNQIDFQKQLSNWAKNGTKYGIVVKCKP